MTDSTKKPNATLERKVRKGVSDLQAKGERPTNAAVREITGGSFRDITPIVKIAVAEQKAAAEAARSAPDMPDEVLDLFASAWEAAWRAADETAAADRRVHAGALAEIEEEKAEALEDIALVEDERDTAIAEAAVAKERAQTAEQRVTCLVEELVAAKVRIAALEGRLLGREDAAPMARATLLSRRRSRQTTAVRWPCFRKPGTTPRPGKILPTLMRLRWKSPAQITMRRDGLFCAMIARHAPPRA